MLGWLKRKPSTYETLRSLLFGDALPPIARGRQPNVQEANVPRFWVEIRELYARGERAATVERLLAAARDLAADSRLRLEAWRALRSLGTAPSVDERDRVEGVVVETRAERGLVSLAAYSDRTARHLIENGPCLVWDARHPDVDARIDSLLAAADAAARRFTAHESRADKPIPALGLWRFSVLTPAGIKTPQATTEDTDSNLDALIRAAVALVSTLNERQRGSTETRT